ncbi:MAG: hypothetical protein LBB56_00655 [Chitinispirillales bacterium]|jgi:hypothetical protein|nr:hypothetical protein [Chitinispirillales bacterium]
MRSLQFSIFILFSAVICHVSAQVIVEDDIVTRDVNLFEPAVNDNQLNIYAAMGASLVLPGIGHYYVDKPKNAFVYLAVDLASIFGAAAFHGFAVQREKDARAFACAAAGIENAPKNDVYWRRVGAFMDAHSYNEAVEISRGSVDDMYLDNKEWWHWADESQQKEYNDIRQKSRNFRVTSSFFIGALVANRIVSTVDLKVFHRKSLTSKIQFEPALAPDTRSSSLTLKTEF